MDPGSLAWATTFICSKLSPIGSQGYVPGAQKPAFGVSSPRIGVAAMFLSVNKRRDAI